MISPDAAAKLATLVIERDREGSRDILRGYKIFVDGNRVGTIRRGARW